MKTNKIFASAMVALALLATGCNPETEATLNSLTLDQTTATVAVDGTVTLTAVTDPANYAATITWESANTAVATVADGVVTGVSEGTAMIVATAEGKTASCLVTVSKGGNDGDGDGDGDGLHASLQGSEYYPFILDGTSATKIQSKIVADFRPDDTTKFLYIWDGTYTAGNATGLNFYGNTDGYTALVVAAGWSGFGINVPITEVAALYEKIAAAPGDYYFHIAMKSTDTYSHCFYLLGVESAASKFIIGSTVIYDGPIKTNFTRDGAWHEIEFPLSDLNLTGFNAAPTDGLVNVFVGLTEGVTGAQLNMDACFIYKK